MILLKFCFKTAIFRRMSIFIYEYLLGKTQIHIHDNATFKNIFSKMELHIICYGVY